MWSDACLAKRGFTENQQDTIVGEQCPGERDECREGYLGPRCRQALRRISSVRAVSTGRGKLRVRCWGVVAGRVSERRSEAEQYADTEHLHIVGVLSLAWRKTGDKTNTEGQWVLLAGVNERH